MRANRALPQPVTVLFQPDSADSQDIQVEFARSVMRSRIGGLALLGGAGDDRDDEVGEEVDEEEVLVELVVVVLVAAGPNRLQYMRVRLPVIGKR